MSQKNKKYIKVRYIGSYMRLWVVKQYKNREKYECIGLKSQSVAPLTRYNSI